VCSKQSTGFRFNSTHAPANTMGLAGLNPGRGLTGLPLECHVSPTRAAFVVVVVAFG